jgi:glucose-6-phosphate isomerase
MTSPTAFDTIAIDTANMYAERVGPSGLERPALAALAPTLRQIHERLRAETAGGLDSEYACLNLHDAMRAWLPAIEQAAGELRRFRDILLIGIGGSSLGTAAVHHALAARRGDMARLHFVENVDPYDLYRLLGGLQPRTSALLVISKSGETIETIAQYLILRDWLTQTLGPEAARHQQWIVTDPQRGWLRRLCDREHLASLPLPPKVGGRYSVLSPVGLLPLAAVGVDIVGLLDGAAHNAARCQSPDSAENPALELAALYYLLDHAHGKRVSIMMPYVNRLQLLVDWYCQLWAESLGKRRDTTGQDPAGTLPVRAMGAIDQHSQLQMYLESRPDKMFTFLELARWEHDAVIPLDDAARAAFPYLHDRSLAEVIHAEFRATRQVISEAGHPNLTIALPALDAPVLGQLIDLYQRVTVYAATLYGVNPLDQPSVEKGKRLAMQYLADRGG